MAPAQRPIIKLPQYMVNPFLDESRGGEAAVSAMRMGRSALTIPSNTGLGIGFGGRQSSGQATGSLGIQGNRRVNQTASLTNNKAPLTS